MSVPKIVVHTDVLLDHLRTAKSPSVLRQAMGKFFCYTTVFQAIELFALARTEQEAALIEDAMCALKVLGLSARNARRYAALMATRVRNDRWNMLVAGLCLESRLPILTDRRSDFGRVKGLTIVPTGLVARYGSGQEILKAVRG
jgi:predicted nucleic acid-binding protein